MFHYCQPRMIKTPELSLNASLNPYIFGQYVLGAGSHSAGLGIQISDHTSYVQTFFLLKLNTTETKLFHFVR